MLTGAYSSLFVASPLLGWLKARSPAFAGRHSGAGDHLVGDDLRAVVIAGPGGRAGRCRPGARRRRRVPTRRAGPTRRPSRPPPPTAVAPAAAGAGLLTHPPRPRKKKRR